MAANFKLEPIENDFGCIVSDFEFDAMDDEGWQRLSCRLGSG